MFATPLLKSKVMFVWLPQFSASALASASMKIVVVRFVDSDAVLIADADFSAIDARTQRLDADANAVPVSMKRSLGFISF